MTGREIMINFIRHLAPKDARRDFEQRDEGSIPI